MKTESMRKRLEALSDAGKLQIGTYDLMPSDCKGDGYDIALISRPDESGEYRIGDLICNVSCSVQVGSTHWGEGVPSLYELVITTPESVENDRPKTEDECIGWQVYALCRRMGGRFRDIWCLTIYEVTPRKTMKYKREIRSCVANRAQFEDMRNLTKPYGYVTYRPVYADVVKKLMAGELR